MTSVGDTSATFCATLVDEWLRAGIDTAVVAPGSRSTPLAVALVHRKEMKVHLFHDERSASFAAVGIGLASGKPAILLCTSGTAATHFHGAVAEANLSHIPLIVCTADRPPELKDVGAPQTIDQTQLFGSAVRWFHDPGVPSFDAAHSWRSLASRTAMSSLLPVPGPVHLNLPFREPLLGEVQNMPQAREGAWWSQHSTAIAHDQATTELSHLISGKQGVIIAGRGATAQVSALADKLGWPVFADSRSGLRNNAPTTIMAFDAILRSEGVAASLQPDFVLRVGEPPASKVLTQWVNSLNATVMQFLPNYSVSDPDHLVAVTLVGDIDDACVRTGALVASCSSDWLKKWQDIESRAQSAIDSFVNTNFCEPAIARVVTSSCTSESNLVVSSSMPIRDVEWFGASTGEVKVFSNRGANGIDGVISTAVGVALASGKPTTVLIGDVACVHDSNGLWGLANRDVDVKIVVTNNDGGSIFSFLPQASALDHDAFEFLYGTPHGVSFENLASAHGIAYAKAVDADSLNNALRSNGTCLIEVPCNRSINVQQHQALNELIVNALQ